MINNNYKIDNYTRIFRIIFIILFFSNLRMTNIILYTGNLHRLYITNIYILYPELSEATTSIIRHALHEDLHASNKQLYACD